MMGRTRIYYRCRDCRTARQGSQEQLFCDECGGELDMIGYVGALAESPYSERVTRGR